MGNLLSNCCTDSRGDKNKAGAFEPTESPDDGRPEYYPTVGRHDSSKPSEGGVVGSSGEGGEGGAGGGSEDRLRESLAAEAERQRALREEQARLELIVSTAGRDMVPVGRTRDAPGHHGAGAGGGGGGGYYDPAYAAAAAQEIHSGGTLGSGHLQSEVRSVVLKCLVDGRIPRTVLPANDPGAILDTLGRGRWDGVELGRRGGPGGCGGEDPEIFFDDLAEGYLNRMVPTKEALFRGVGQIVENLP